MADDSEFESDVLKAAIDEIVSKVQVSREYDIPYVAGMNTASTTVYIDRHLPVGLCEIKGKQVDVARFIVLHEVIESLLMTRFGLSYSKAHQVALYAERSAVEAEGVDWYAYDEYIEHWLDKLLEDKCERVPKDLNFTPYLENEEDWVIKEMQEAQRDKVTVAQESRCRCDHKHRVSAKW